MKLKENILEDKMNNVNSSVEQYKIQRLSDGLNEIYNSIPKDIKKHSLFLDADDVLMNTSVRFIDKYNKDFQSNPLHRWAVAEDLWDWGYKSVCPLATPEWIDNFFSSMEDVMSINPMPYAKNAIKRLSKLYDIKVVTIGVPENIAAKTKWFSINFPTIENIIYICNKGCKMDKSVINMENGIFIDDNYENLKSSNASIKIAYGNIREYNRLAKLRVTDFNELEGYLVNLAKEIYA